LFRTSNYASRLTHVYRSSDPLDFGRDEDSKYIGTIPVAAPEIVESEGRSYISSVHDLRGGIQLARLRWVLIAPLAAMWLLAAIELLRVADGGRAALVLGQTWRECPFRIAILSLPAFAALFWAMREWAPTRLRLAGAAAGLCAGGVGAFVYTFHCPELAASFLGVWYVIGMLIPAVAGAWLGPRLLRW